MNYTKGDWKPKYDHVLGNHYVMSGEVAICELIAGADDKANAHLIAAAPNLYEALKALAEWKLGSSFTDNHPLLPPGLTGNQIKAMVNNALAKAEGK